MPDHLPPVEELTLQPQEVPSDLFRLALDAVIAIEDDGAWAVTGQQEVAVALAAVLPEHARQVRADAGEDTLAEFERFTVNRVRFTVQQTVNACFVSADRAGLYEEFRERIEQRIREQVAQELLAVDPGEWALAGQRAGLDAARIARKEGQ